MSASIANESKISEPADRPQAVALNTSRAAEVAALLRNADTRTLSEPQWVDLLQSLAHLSVEEKHEIYVRALSDWPKSVQLWAMYLTYLENCVDVEDSSVDLALVALTYEDALAHTMYHFSRSHDLLEMFLKTHHQLSNADVTQLYLARLAIPSRNIKQLYESYSRLLGSYDAQEYESMMESCTEIYAPASKATQARLPWEDKLNGSETDLAVFEEYVAWELQQKDTSCAFQLCLNLLERATGRFNQHLPFWNQLFNLLLQRNTQDHEARTQLQRRAVRSVPDDVVTWARLIRCQANPEHDYDVWMNIIERALAVPAISSSPQAVYQVVVALVKAAQCSDVDLAPAINIAKKLCRQYKVHDSDFIVIKLETNSLVERGNVAEARSMWKKHAKLYGATAMFWLYYYHWELRVGGDSASIRALLKSGCFAVQDAPQLIYNLAEDYELLSGDMDSYEKTMAVISKATMLYLNRHPGKRTVSATEAESVQESTRKRQRNDGVAQDAANESAPKRVKPETASDTMDPMRDREKNSLILHGILASADESEIKLQLQELGVPEALEVNIANQVDDPVVYLEFKTAEDCEAAHAKCAIAFGNEAIERANETLLYVTDYPADYDQEKLRSTFSQFGYVCDVRMPSLKFDQHRRFAYIQMSSRQSANAAVRASEGRSNSQFFAQISNPASKAPRSDPVSQEREVFVKRISWKATKEQVEDLFKGYGEILSLRMPSTISRAHHDGIAFIDYKEAASAKAALEQNGKIFMSLKLEVSISKPKRSHKERMTSPERTHSSSDRTITQQKTLYVSNLLDTVSSAQLQSVFGLHGKICNIQLQPSDGSAVIEYDDAASVGRASLALNGTVMAGNVIHVAQSAALARRQAGDDGRKPTQKMLAPRQTVRKVKSKVERTS